MAVTQIDLDEEALATVMRATGERTKKGAVNLALREYAAREQRRRAFEQLPVLAEKVLDHDVWAELRAQDRTVASWRDS